MDDYLAAQICMKYLTFMHGLRNWLRRAWYRAE